MSRNLLLHFKHIRKSSTYLVLQNNFRYKKRFVSAYFNIVRETSKLRILFYLVDSTITNYVFIIMCIGTSGKSQNGVLVQNQLHKTQYSVEEEFKQGKLYVLMHEVANL